MKLKLKTKHSAKKRVKITATFKFKRKKANNIHLFLNKTNNQIKNLSSCSLINNFDLLNYKLMLPYYKYNNI